MDKECKINKKISVAVIGCGAISEQQHIPALRANDDCEVVALVDRNEGRVNELAKRFDVPNAFTDQSALSTNKVDAAIVAVPNHLHVPLGLDLLEQGIHVLVEKPLALSSADCDKMLDMQQRTGTILAVGLVRRYMHTSQFARWAIKSGLLGTIESFDIEDGFVFAWPVASDYLLRPEQCGGGVLMDLGVHTIDQMLWWLGDVDELTYFDDSYGGVEADCRIELIMSSGARGTVEMSRTRNLRNTAVIRGSKAHLEVGLGRNHMKLNFLDGQIEVWGSALPTEAKEISDHSGLDLVSRQLSDFLSAIGEQGVPSVSGKEARRSVDLIERCYANKQPLILPWSAGQLVGACNS